MLSSMVKQHQLKQLGKKENVERKKQEALTAANLLSNSLVDHLNEGVAQAYLNQRKLDSEAKQLQSNINNFSKQATQWRELMEGLNKAVNELGDVENWSKSIEADMRLISTSLEYAYKVGQPNQ
ncbi:Biogenesis of lysosome-related organelles complex 1 subunit 1 [Halotydeus destructor]|nr:Biogenesis of lysosome-related organelles complex 1 subunit 1 [Halotydeus destructor]